MNPWYTVVCAKQRNERMHSHGHHTTSDWSFPETYVTSLLLQPQADFGSRMAEVYAACAAMLSTIAPQFLQTMDESIALDEQRREEWTVVRADMRTLVCVFGEICFRRRYDRHKVSGEMAYLLDRFLGILYQRHPGAQGCSAEGHVSHILSDRLSSRPLGWSVENMENIAQLRVMKANGQVIRYG